jgi:hypothetical protein
MFKLTVLFLALLNGTDGASVPVGFARADGIPDKATCEQVGEYVTHTMGPRVDAALRQAQVGVLQGTKIVCEPMDSGERDNA